MREELLATFFPHAVMEMRVQLHLHASPEKTAVQNNGDGGLKIRLNARAKRKERDKAIITPRIA